ncbi:phage tail protein [Polaribacter sp. KT 15]|uniref:phage tail protein n=1 Tax=Polaribacter sp. KT 15 TaxID=1896175 RepID=UPI00090C0CE8|nr:tail fiber protein [Polaribacter sp. KT 15]SHM95392.1 Microcystin-dependent protein [Polaribacter sp. KT 15]
MEPFIGQIMAFVGNFAIRGWAKCDGQLMSISENTALFSIIGTTYGGDGRTTFALPDLRGRVPMHYGTGNGLTTRPLGARGGQETHTLTSLEMPSHSHTVLNNSAQDQHVMLSKDAAVNQIPAEGDVPAAAQFGSGLSATKVNAFGPATNLVNGQTISGSAGLTIANNGGSQAHNNMQPFETVNYLIALVGVFPSRS